ncbi:GM2 ganglioside activator [Pycnococcus provasolii]
MRIDARMRIVTLVCAVAALTTAPGGVSCARIPTQTEADIMSSQTQTQTTCRRRSRSSSAIVTAERRKVTQLLSNRSA